TSRALCLLNVLISNALHVCLAQKAFTQKRSLFFTLFFKGQKVKSLTILVGILCVGVGASLSVCWGELILK
ncbi:MAG: hypothetical protein SFY56_07620, partial [Bacteroidota bacterium]|nr:hypothetical protein [Bacteroidota bacterium]